MGDKRGNDFGKDNDASVSSRGHMEVVVTGRYSVILLNPRDGFELGCKDDSPREQAGGEVEVQCTRRTGITVG